VKATVDRFSRAVLAALLLMAAGPGLALADGRAHPLGDGKTSLTGPKKGHLYLCRPMAGGGGAFRAGPWIKDGRWSPALKTVTVAGDVAWPGASLRFELAGDARNVTGNALPSHRTGMFPVRPGDPAYQYDRNPNSIRAHEMKFSLPARPAVAAAASCVGGEAGIALTGAYLFNGLDAGGRDAAAYEIQDAFGGHPQPAGVYHYHHVSPRLEALFRRAGAAAALVGYAFDGFGILGAEENGKRLTNDDLDDCHGHIHAIAWDGLVAVMYHYHATDEFPYTVGCYRGTPVRLPPVGGALGGPPPGRPPGGPMGGPPGRPPPPQ
jgi:hypothetical protein